MEGKCFWNCKKGNQLAFRMIDDYSNYIYHFKYPLASRPKVLKALRVFKDFWTNHLVCLNTCVTFCNIHITCKEYKGTAVQWVAAPSHSSRLSISVLVLRFLSVHVCEFHMFSFCLDGFPLAFHNHASRWNGNAKLSQVWICVSTEPCSSLKAYQGWFLPENTLLSRNHVNIYNIFIVTDPSIHLLSELGLGTIHIWVNIGTWNSVLFFLALYYLYNNKNIISVVIK